MSTNGHAATSELIRHEGAFRCPICGGTEDDRRGQGVRCWGFTSGDFCRCTREEHAGSADFDNDSEAWVHRLKGDCKCGRTHGPADPPKGRPKKPRLGNPTAVYDYVTPDGELRFRVQRFPLPGGEKTFRQRRPDGKRGWVNDLKGVELIPYNLPAVAASSAGDDVVFFVEGEKDVQSLASRGLVGTCNPMGVGKWREDYSRWFVGRHCVVIPDNDVVGRKHAEDVAASLHAAGAASVKLVELDGLPPKGDVTDWFAAGGTAEDLMAIAGAMPEWEPPEPDPKVDIVNLWEPWPVGTRVKALDRGNFGTVVEDRGDDKALVHFDGAAGQANVWLPRSELVRLDGGGGGQATGDPEPFDLGLIDSAAFAVAEYPREYIVENVLVDRQPCIVGGPHKAMKTSLMVALALAIASGRAFLGRFVIPRARRVTLLCGESGEATVQETARRVAENMEIDLGGLGDMVCWGFRLPMLSDPTQLAALSAAIREKGVEVVIIDPLYLCLIGTGIDVNAANLFQMGPLLRSVAAACLDAGATPILVHHLRKNRDDPLGPPELEDLAFAGVVEFARQWLLIGRRTPYVPGSGRHEIWLNYGGSAGHGGSWALDVEEGVADHNLAGRYWSVSLNPAGEVRDTTRVAKALATQQAKDEATRAKAETDATEVATYLKKHGPATERALRGPLGWGVERTARAVCRALDQGWIERTIVQVKRRSGTEDIQGYQACYQS